MTKIAIEDDIAVITLSHGVTNSLTLDHVREIDSVVNQVNREEKLKGIVLTGEGRFFCSGFHLPDFIAFKDLDEACKWFEEEEAILLRLFCCDKPVVCAMNGHSAAAGIIYAMASDYRLVKNHPKIKLGMSEFKIGLSLAVVHAAVVQYGLDSKRVFRDVMFFGKMYGVEEALKIGMVDEIVEEDRLILRAKEIISNWIDTPDRPFIPVKRKMKEETVLQIKRTLEEGSWREALRGLLKEDVRRSLEYVQSTMPK